MALLDRVATLVRANLNDLLDAAENPEKMLKQVILDMENQFIQVKTQVAIALADLHVLQRKKKENADKHAEWMKKAELAVDKRDDELARAALQRALSFAQLADNLDAQTGEQEARVDSLKAALKRLELKLTEARSKAEALILQHRRSRAASAGRARQSFNGEHPAFDRMRSTAAHAQALDQANAELTAGDIEARLELLEREQKIDALLREIKAKKGIPDRAG